MALILNIESSTEVCSVALALNGQVIDILEETSGSRHSELLTILIEALLKSSGCKPIQLDCIAVSKGPGSYTGLRIGISVAKGLCYSLEKPLIAVSTLDAMAYYVSHHPSDFGLKKNDDYFLCPMTDARRMEVYMAVYDSAGECIEPISARIIDPDSFLYLLRRNKTCFFGNGSVKCKGLLSHPNAVFPGPEKASASFMDSLSEIKYNKKEFEDVAYFEPFYLKDFVATISKNKVV